MSCQRRLPDLLIAECAILSGLGNNLGVPARPPGAADCLEAVDQEFADRLRTVHMDLGGA